MASLKRKHNQEDGDRLPSIFNNDRTIIGFSRGGEDAIIITDEVKVVKYQLETQRILQEWRTEAAGNTLSCAAVKRDDRYFAAVDTHTIMSWKSSKTYIDRGSKKLKVQKPCFGLLEQSGHIFSIHTDGSLHLLSDQNKFWSCSFSQNVNIISTSQLQRGSSDCDLIVAASNGTLIELAKYQIHVRDLCVDVIAEPLGSCQEMLMKFKIGTMKLLFLDDLQCIVYGTLQENGKEGIYLLNERHGSFKCFMDFDSKLYGDVVQLSRAQDNILISTTRNIFEVELTYRPPLFCSVILENDMVTGDGTNFRTRNEMSFEVVCNKLKSWLKPKMKLEPECSFDGVDLQMQDFFNMLGSISQSKKEVSLENKMALVPLLCQFSYNLEAEVFVQMLSFILSLTSGAHAEKVPQLLSQVVKASLPDKLLRSLASLEFGHVQTMMMNLLDHLSGDDAEMDCIINWMNLLLDSHHARFTLAKDLDIIKLIKRHVNLLCDEAKECNATRFVEELKHRRIQNKLKAKKNCYIELFEL